MATIGDRIKQKRLEQGLSVEQLANRLGKNKAAVYRYENGDIENLPISILDPLSKALNTSPVELLGWDDSTQFFSQAVNKYEESTKRWLATGAETLDEIERLNKFVADKLDAIEANKGKNTEQEQKMIDLSFIEVENALSEARAMIDAFNKDANEIRKKSDEAEQEVRNAESRLVPLLRYIYSGTLTGDIKICDEEIATIKLLLDNYDIKGTLAISPGK